MKTSKNYLLLSALFLTAYLVVEFTDIYGDPGWFKFYSLICCAAFLIGGISLKRKNK